MDWTLDEDQGPGCGPVDAGLFLLPCSCWCLIIMLGDRDTRVQATCPCGLLRNPLSMCVHSVAQLHVQTDSTLLNRTAYSTLCIYCQRTPVRTVTTTRVSLVFRHYCEEKMIFSLAEQNGILVY